DVIEINGTTVSEFLEWVTNNLRTIVYSIGKVNDATTSLASLPWKLHHNSFKIRAGLFFQANDAPSQAYQTETSTLTEMNIPATMQALPFANSDYDYKDGSVHKRIYYAEFGRFSEVGRITQGRILGI
ncbi:MAG: hypothetical protein QXT63_07835, partial [Thermoplasmata archaeon]